MRYEWNPEQDFTIKGSDLAIFNAMMEMYMTNPMIGQEVQEATRVLNLHTVMMEGKTMFNKLMEDGLKSGIVIGTADPTSDTNTSEGTILDAILPTESASGK